MFYSTVIDGAPGSPAALPFRIRLADGTTRTSLSELSDAELAELGFYPVDEVRPEYDPEIQGLGAPTLTFNGARVTATYPVEALPVPRIETARAEKKTAATAMRREVETGGILVNGMAVATGTEDQNRIAASVIYLGNHPEGVINWKGPRGWSTVTKDAIDAIAAAVGAHVEACFSAERAHHEALDALLTSAEVAAYDVGTGWPGA